MSTRGRKGLLLVHGLIALVFAVSVGCSMPYVYPSISSNDALDLVRLSGEIFAFRIEADGWVESAKVEMKDYRLSPITLDSEGRVPFQLNVSLEYGVCALGKDSPSHGTTHWSKIRLYRRGYRLIEIDPDRKDGRVQWLPAVGVLAQEKAVDDLLWPPADSRVASSQKRDKEIVWAGTLVGPGSLSSKHREALRFVAGEYDRLILVWGADANAPVNVYAPPKPSAPPKLDAVIKARLEQKAKDLRERADR